MLAPVCFASRLHSTSIGKFFPRNHLTATAHKLARLFYQIWTTAGRYTDPGMDYYEQKYQDLILKNLQKKAQAFGLQLVPKSQDKEEALFYQNLST
ncbi:MAG: hypothetical protein V7K26_15790 [Nostoc sp.]|uniref:hypothetical protein n=1 Tax=Nostoc sp. TaxID=1180 RepID=UPI002FEEB9E9